MLDQPIRVFVSDDQRLFRAGIIALLDRMPDLAVVGEAGDDLEALELILKLKPDLLLLNISIHRVNGISLLLAVAQKLPDTKYVVLSMNTDKPHVLRALKLGASAYLVKDSEAYELELAIKAVMRGEVYLSSRVSKHLVHDAIKRSGEPSENDKALTARQREVLKLIALGHTTKSIARELQISRKTADTHRTQLMERLDIHEIAGLVRFAIRKGIVDAEVEL